MSIARLQRLTRGFSNFSVAGLQPTDGSSGSPGLGPQPLVSQPARDALRLVLSSEGSYLQVRGWGCGWGHTRTCPRPPTCEERTCAGRNLAVLVRLECLLKHMSLAC